MRRNIIIAISGASGAIYAKRLLEVLKEDVAIDTHLIISKAAHITIKQELEIDVKNLIELADYHYSYKDISACISSGSFRVDGMIIAPCSIKTMSEIATCNANNLISRAADVALKEKKKLLLCVRETPLHGLHLENMKKLSDTGAMIFPPVPAFYNNPQTIDDIVNHSVGRMLDYFDIDVALVKRWKGVSD